MPGRNHLLTTDCYYHVYNKTIDGKRTLENPAMLKKFKEVIWYYRSSATPLRYSDYLRAPDERRKQVNEILTDVQSFRISVLAYCIMPTHYHFLLRQVVDGGISMFISQIQNSFTRYFNTLKSRKGPLFLHRFKSRPIESEADIIHLARYIHLNPYSCGYLPGVQDALNYRGSSFFELTDSSTDPKIAQGETILSYFDDDLTEYKDFVVRNAEYQKRLERLK